MARLWATVLTSGLRGCVAPYNHVQLGLRRGGRRLNRGSFLGRRSDGGTGVCINRLAHIDKLRVGKRSLGFELGHILQDNIHARSRQTLV